MILASKSINLSIENKLGGAALVNKIWFPLHGKNDHFLIPKYFYTFQDTISAYKGIVKETIEVTHKGGTVLIPSILPHIVNIKKGTNWLLPNPLDPEDSFFEPTDFVMLSSIVDGDTFYWKYKSGMKHLILYIMPMKYSFRGINISKADIEDGWSYIVMSRIMEIEGKVEL